MAVRDTVDLGNCASGRTSFSYNAASKGSSLFLYRRSSYNFLRRCIRLLFFRPINIKPIDERVAPPLVLSATYEAAYEAAG